MPHDLLSQIDTQVKKNFDSNLNLLSFQEYLNLLAKNPRPHLRGSAEYIADMMDFFGKREVSLPKTSEVSGKLERFALFDEPVDGAVPKIVGLEHVQQQIYRTLRGFQRQGQNSKLILLHGPNGSAKSSIVHALMGGLERYSRTAEGAIYTFEWVFPLEKSTKGNLGLTPDRTKHELDTYAHLTEEEIGAMIPSNLRDHPFLLIPREHRKAMLVELIGAEATDKFWKTLPHYLVEGDLNHRCKQVFETLLRSYNGNLKKVLSHIRVERFYYSRRYRAGVASVEPQLHVDAQYQQLSVTKNLANLPSSLQSLNLFVLGGEVVDSNRGIIEFNDLLKRPVDSFKYLLIACEKGSVNVGPVQATLDCVMMGSTNELQLDAFKEFPDFTSFKARFELIRVPYLLSYTQEKEIYQAFIQRMGSTKPVAPHVDEALALWAVLSRMKKPNAVHYPPQLSGLVSSLTPLEKATFYDTGDVPAQFTADERKLLRSHLDRVREEYENVPFYEGRLGASVREMKTILFEAAENPEFAALTPIPVFKALDSFIKHVSEHEFLRQEPKDGYHDVAKFVDTVQNEYLNTLDQEVRSSIGMYDTKQWELFIQKYVHQVSFLLKKEKVVNPITKKHEDPDITLIKEFEGIVGAPVSEGEEKLTVFRQNTLSLVGAWSLDHKNEAVQYGEIFPEFRKRLEKHYFESQKAVMTKLYNALLVYGKDEDNPDSEGSKLVRKSLDELVTRYGYTAESAKEVVFYLLKQRY